MQSHAGFSIGAAALGNSKLCGDETGRSGLYLERPVLLIRNVVPH